MKKGSLVRIKTSADDRFVGSFAIVLHVSSVHSDAFVIKRFLDGRELAFHRTRLEVICK
jgi:hypothetical protein